MSLTYQSMLAAVKLVLKAGNVPNIVGEAGIGKSALVEQVAKQLNAKLYTTVVSLSEKGDLAIPVPPLTDRSFVETEAYGSLANVKFGYSETLVDIIQHAEQFPNQKIIWFLDEFNRGTQAVQSELMNLVLQRQINSLKLPKQVQIVIAENPDSTMAGFEDSDYGVVAGDSAIKDRTVRLVLRVSATDWLKWARSRIHSSVRAYISESPEMLSPKNHGEDLYPTPRAWQRVSDNLKVLQHRPAKLQDQLRLDLLQGDLGEQVGAAFNSFIKEEAHHIAPATLAAADDDEFSKLQFEFQTFDEIQKQKILVNWVNSADRFSLADARNARRFFQLLKQISKDGQFVIVQEVGKIEHLEDILKPMFAQFEAAPDVVSLYRYFGRVATRNDAGDE